VKKFSIILPTLNESQNLSFLIPQIFETLNKSNSNFTFEIIVIDDNSEDDTKEVIEELKKDYLDLKFVIRKNDRSLSMSILEAIRLSENDYVIWLDADGSMPAATLSVLINEQLKAENNVIIGSRFIEGGGYKGMSNDKNKNIFSAILNVSRSKDSVLGLILSLIFNKVLTILLPTGVKDITSGFISIDRNLISDEVFKDRVYGEYFIYLVTDLIKKKIVIKEIGYVCGTRYFGESKTAPNIFKLIKRGVPYLKASYICRKELYGNKR